MNIRASFLPGYSDCARRAVGKQFRKKFEAAGYEFRKLAPSVGSAAGTAVHSGVAEYLKAKWQGKNMAADEATHVALAGFTEEIDPGCEWDDTTPNPSTAEFQINRMIQAYIAGPGREQVPLTVNGAPALELHLEANAGDGWMLTGTLDLLARDDGFVHDTKTGSIMRPYHAQLGAYSLLVRSNKVIPTVNGCCMDFIKRCRKTKLQDPVITVCYDVSMVEKVAMGTICRIKEDMFKFDETGDLDRCFPSNLLSMMHSPKYCPCHGTDFCPMSK